MQNLGSAVETGRDFGNFCRRISIFSNHSPSPWSCSSNYVSPCVLGAAFLGCYVGSGANFSCNFSQFSSKCIRVFAVNITSTTVTANFLWNIREKCAWQCFEISTNYICNSLSRFHSLFTSTDHDKWPYLPLESDFPPTTSFDQRKLLIRRVLSPLPNFIPLPPIQK